MVAKKDFLIVSSQRTRDIEYALWIRRVLAGATPKKYTSELYVENLRLISTESVVEGEKKACRGCNNLLLVISSHYKEEPSFYNYIIANFQTAPNKEKGDIFLVIIEDVLLKALLAVKFQINIVGLQEDDSTIALTGLISSPWLMKGSPFPGVKGK